MTHSVGSRLTRRSLTIARRVQIVSGAIALMLLTSAHVGSPDSWFDGKAGPYPVRVIIRSPSVIPARAEVSVRTTGTGVRSVTATARVWNGGERGSPPPDSLARVPGDSALWSIQLWIMRQGSYAVLVHVSGTAGDGTAVVPYTAVARSVLGMNRGMAVALAAVGVFLLTGLVTIAGAAAEATRAPGTPTDVALVKRMWRVRASALVVIVIALVAGRAWWIAEDRAYAAALYRSLTPVVTVAQRADGPALVLSVDGPAVRQFGWAPLVPDHGKLMHLFLVRENDLGALAHLHPVALDSLTFESPLPPLPAGRYHVFADIVRESGFAETMVAEVALSAEQSVAQSARATNQKRDRDDATFVGAMMGPAFRFSDNSSLTWLGASEQHVAGRDAALRFSLRDANGSALTVEPYLGMEAHAVVARMDGKVYVHLHPAGTTSMGAQQALVMWSPADSLRGSLKARLEQTNATDAMAMTNAPLSGEFGFPYAFPGAGSYRVWVQFRRGGMVRTAAFDVAVSASDSRAVSPGSASRLPAP